ncbi:hypothetical protein A6A04_01860 [Paramagnetospirillum marisnigri]|uniref:Motility accessory factor Maf-2 n=2 Tax=Paramagnetospirillum marisnigri TaxID=1285242 RepID=A0A178MN32_9PROT|nr:hypothetical protein A6A04_01860 [Paramagnetospirillum marisnigri]
MRPYQNADRYKSNLRQLSRHGHLSGLPPLSSAATRLVIDGAGNLNVDIGGGNLLYPGDAQAAVERQVASFLETPSRCFCKPEEVFEDGAEVNWLYRSLRDRLASFPKAETQAPFAGFLVVFGLGLGHHVRMLAERLRFKALIVIETHDDFINHSLHVVDWAGLAQSLARSDRSLHFVRGPNLYGQIVSIINSDDYALLDGSYLYAHYQTPEYTDLIQKLFFKAKDLTMLPGWVEDQLLVFRNATANFARSGYWLQRARVPSRRRRPAFVIGAGPSLDKDLDDIKRCRDQVVVITASSGLKPCLENGIRPDIHCELENSPGLGDVAESLAAKYDLSGITLYATPSVDPRISPCFDKTVYFFRSGLSSTVFYGQGADHTPLAEPTSGNTAVYCALSLGFKEIYLFGLDFGARDPNHHHSRHSVYFTYEDEAELATYTPYQFDYTLPGNFGGAVNTGWLLNLGQTVVGQAIAQIGDARVMNCSDGCRIPGAAPLAAEAIALADPPCSVAVDLEAALAELARVGEPLTRPDDFARLGASLRGFAADCRDILHRLDPHGAPQGVIVAFCDQVNRRLGALKEDGGAAYGIIIGHSRALTSGAFHYASTLDQADDGGGLAALIAVLDEGLARLGPVIDATFG